MKYQLATLATINSYRDTTLNKKLNLVYWRTDVRMYGQPERSMPMAAEAAGA